MLQSLRIRNIAVIDSAEVSFKPGLNILSGETGAGKSIVIQAISLLLGSRASTDLIRSGADEAVVEGLFDLTDIEWMRARLQDLGFEVESDEFLIRRSVSKSGKHRIHVNGQLATLSILQKLGEGLIDLCGQHEHQSLLRAPVQLELLDRYGGSTKQAGEFSEIYVKYTDLLQEKRAHEEAEAQRLQRADFLRFQIEELRAADLQPGEDERLQQEKLLLQSAESRIKCADAVREALEGSLSGADSDAGALNLIRSGLQQMRSLIQLDPSMQPLNDGLERAIAELEEVSLELNRYLGMVDLDPSRLDEVHERVSLLADLRRKYGASVEQMLQTLEKLEGELAGLDQIEQKLEQVDRELASLASDLTKKAGALSTKRKKAAGLLGDSVTAELHELQMPDANLRVDLTRKEELEDFTASGADQIQFMVQTNRGESERPIGKIASGGELSRLMLAVRRVIADRGGIGVYLFDEIDAGIGGQTAFVVGRKLKSVAKFNQVICITHLPQVASFADHHLIVRKQAQGKRTVTEIAELTTKERTEELARMLGGPKLTRKSLENAEELISLAAN